MKKSKAALDAEHDEAVAASEGAESEVTEPTARSAKPAGKQQVQYRITPHTYIVVGDCAFVFPVGHPDTDNVSGLNHATTSTVLSYDIETGEFETKNSLYKPFTEPK